MLERLYCFLVVLLLMFSGEIFGQFGKQKNSPASSFSSTYKKEACVREKYFLSLPGTRITDKKNEKYVGFRSIQLINSPILPVKSISPSFYFNGLGFVCKKEWQLEKMTSIPFRIRLGSLAYVNYLEQK